MKAIKEQGIRSLVRVASLTAGAGATVFFAVLMSANADAREQAQRIADFESDSAKWGKFYPNQFAAWKATEQMEGTTKYGGATKRDNLEDDPKRVILWAGFAFAKDYNAPRGHAYALEDVKATKRLSDKTPGACWTCKSPDVPRLIDKYGKEAFYSSKFTDYTNDVTNSIGCGDCHDNKTMKLKITRPALIEAYDRMGKDVKKATKDEMRSLVCAQCHVTYYFKGPKKEVTFPWDKGLNIDQVDEYFQTTGADFADWTHSISGAKMVKIRHPEFEIHQSSIHAFRGVSCADCHMPPVTKGKATYTDHQIRSPLLQVEKVCSNCHDWTVEEVKARVEWIQDNTAKMIEASGKHLVQLHLEIGDAAKLGATDDELKGVRNSVRRAQLYWDWISSNNGVGFHAPQESARSLNKALEITAEARLEVARIRAKHGASEPLAGPDISNKEKAQGFIKPFVEAQAAAAKAAVKPPLQ